MSILKALLPAALLLLACDASNPVAPPMEETNGSGSGESSGEGDSGGGESDGGESGGGGSGSLMLTLDVDPAELVAGSSDPGAIEITLTGSSPPDEVSVTTTLGFFDSEGCNAQLCTLPLEANDDGSVGAALELQPGEEPGMAEILASAGSEIASAIVPIVVVDPPVAGFSYEVEGSTVQFLSTSTGEDLSYFWDFGDGEVCDSCEPHPSHDYAERRTYVVTLRVTNPGGEAEVGQLVTLAPAVDFCWSPTSPGGTTLQFMDLSTPTPETWQWDFRNLKGEPDGSSTIQNPIHVYQDVGFHVVELTITNAGAASGVAKIVCVDGVGVSDCPVEQLDTCEADETAP